MQVECPLCTIPKTEKLLYADDLIYLVETKNKKTHKIRVMVCIQRHDAVPTFVELTKSYFLIFEYMKHKLGLKYKLGLKQWELFDGKYASIPDHFHIVAASCGATDLVELQAMEKTPKVKFPINFPLFV